jgi:hypothetical protein
MKSVDGENKKADPLAAFRRKASDIESASLNRPKEPETYAAFGGKDRVERLEIRRAMAPFRAPRYLLLDDLSFDGFYGTNFVLVFSSMMVLVEGRNLQSLVAAIKTSTVEFIQEYHPDLWEKPADDAAFISSIQIVMKGIDAEPEK